MPIDTYWNAAAPPGDFGSTGNWTNGVPNAAGDVGVFDGRSQVSVEAGLARGAVSFDIKTTPQYVGNIGTPAVPLSWLASGIKRTIIRGSGKSYFQWSTLGGELVIDSQNLVDAVTVHGTLSPVFVKRGGLIVAADADWATASGEQLVLAGPETLADLAFKASSVGPGIFDVRNGRLIVRRPGNATMKIFQSGGIIEWLSSLPSGGNTYLRQSGGTFIFKPDPFAASILSAYIDGILDLSGNIGPSWTAGIIVGLNGQVIPELSNPTFQPSIDLTREYP